ncbi:MAG: hypothetical protein Q7S40_28975 [Opitutaceae bacterium]|nr:hypothetical protein [Opitutaceae bacterium]
MRKSATKIRRRKKTRSAPKRPPSILVLRLDSEKLKADGLSLGNEISFAHQLSAACLRAQVVTVNATTESDLVAQLRALAERRERFDLIVVVAHSNDSIICFASDQKREWPVFATYLEPFAPRQLALIACLAGGRMVANQLFFGLPALDCIYASPECVNVDMANLILVVAAYSLTRGRGKDEVTPWLKTFAFIGMGRRLKVWRRRGGPSGQDIWEDVFAWAMRQ